MSHCPGGVLSLTACGPEAAAYPARAAFRPKGGSAGNGEAIITRELPNKLGILPTDRAHFAPVRRVCVAILV